MSRSIGLVLLTRFPLRNGSDVLVTVIKRRPQHSGIDMVPAPYPGVYELPVRGEILEDDGKPQGDPVYNALIRESKGQLGEYFTKMCMRGVPLTQMVDTAEEFVYSAMIPHEYLDKIDMGPYMALELVTAVQINSPDVTEANNEHLRSVGPVYCRTIAVLPADLRSLRRACEITQP